MAKMNNVEALNNALDIALAKNKNVVMYGEDVGNEGGVFRATQGLQKKYGKERIWDSPISESAIIGTAVGASVAGLKPIVEIQFMGFSYAGIQQIACHASRMRNRSRGRFTAPLIVRMPMGGGIKALEHHSEASEAFFAHIPGLVVIMPANPYDMKGLMLAAVKANDPVIFLEPKKIYRAFKQEVPEGEYIVEIGKANVIKEGKDLTIVTYGAQVHDSLEAIDSLIKTNPNIDIELIDLRTIKPLDMDTIVKSVKKTGRLLVVHEAVQSFSVSSEIITRVNEKAFKALKIAPARVTGYDIVMPLATGEKLQNIDSQKIITKILSMMKE